MSAGFEDEVGVPEAAACGCPWSGVVGLDLFLGGACRLEVTLTVVAGRFAVLILRSILCGIF